MWAASSSFICLSTPPWATTTTTTPSPFLSVITLWLYLTFLWLISRLVERIVGSVSPAKMMMMMVELCSLYNLQMCVWLILRIYFLVAVEEKHSLGSAECFGDPEVLQVRAWQSSCISQIGFSWINAFSCHCVSFQQLKIQIFLVKKKTHKFLFCYDGAV